MTMDDLLTRYPSPKYTDADRAVFRATNERAAAWEAANPAVTPEEAKAFIALHNLTPWPLTTRDQTIYTMPGKHFATDPAVVLHRWGWEGPHQDKWHILIALGEPIQGPADADSMNRLHETIQRQV